MGKTVAKEIPQSFIASEGVICLYADAPLGKTSTDSPATDIPAEIQILTAGDYAMRNLKVTAKQLQEMVDNHVAAGVDPVIDREHESWLSPEAKPALGWIKTLRVGNDAKGDVALFGAVEWNDLGSEAVKNRHFRYISAGFDLNSKNRRTNAPIGAFLDHVALVKKPFVQGMKPLSFSHRPAGAGEKNMEEMTQAKQLLGLSADAEDSAVLLALVANKKQAEETTQALAVATKERVGLAEEVKGLKSEKIKAEVEKAIEDFRFSASERDAQVSLAEKDYALFTSLLALRQPNKPNAMPIVVAADAPRTLGVEKTAEALAAAADKEIRAYMLANKVEYTEAFSAVAVAKPELFDESEGK